MKIEDKISKLLMEKPTDIIPYKKLYFGHPQKYYNTKWETKAIQMIMKEFPQHNVINPSGPKWGRRAKKLGFQPFYQAIKLADIGVFMPIDDSGKLFSGGTYKEAVRTEKEGKEVWVVNPWKNTLKKRKVSTMKSISKSDPYYDKYSWDED